MLFTDPHRTESKQNSAHANHGIRHSLPVSGDINLVDLGRFSREKNYFSFVFIKFLLPIRNKYIMNYKITRKYFSVHIHFKAQESQAYLAIEPAAKWFEFSQGLLKFPVPVEVKSGMFVESCRNGTGF